jgi:hypothetical protein
MSTFLLRLRITSTYQSKILRFSKNLWQHWSVLVKYTKNLNCLVLVIIKQTCSNLGNQLEILNLVINKDLSKDRYKDHKLKHRSNIYKIAEIMIKNKGRLKKCGVLWKNKRFGDHRNSTFPWRNKKFMV